MDGFDSIASPLTTLSQKCKKFEWSEACEKCFIMLKDRLTSVHVLTLPEGTKGFFLYRDSSRVGLWYVLMNLAKVVAYSCSILKVHERTCPTSDLELSVVVFAL